MYIILQIFYIPVTENIALAKIPHIPDYNPLLPNI